MYSPAAVISVAREVLSARALFAAESGAERKLNEIFPPGAVASVPASCSGNGEATDLDDKVDTTFYNPANGNALVGLQGCSQVAVSCHYRVIDTVTYYFLTSNGRCGPANDSAERVVFIQAKDL